ncbi:hypothetical protein [uncultured Jannaschia sp.]|uniref:hypothetical protein n=1 Tax=uncultured Jannaschia sp. TaxID=293347 RepID=UPI002618E698|nr:hypothetical protein [uncultured Jannaschia sp.]
MAFKLKRMPSEMDYDTVRARQKKREKNDSEELVADPPRKPETPEVSDVSEASSPIETKDETVPATDIDSGESDDLLPKPDPEPHKLASGSLVSADSNITPQSLIVSGQSVQKDQETSRAPVNIVEPTDEDQPDRMIIKGYAAQPASGVSAWYDEIAPVYGDRAAMRHFVEVAIAAFTEALEAGQVNHTQIDPIYSSLPKKQQVTRVIPSSSYAIFAGKVDPNGILKPGTVGRAFVQGALNHFVAQEKERNNKHP